MAMGSGKEKKKLLSETGKKQKKKKELSVRPKKLKNKEKEKTKASKGKTKNGGSNLGNGVVCGTTASEQLNFFIHQFQSANRVQLSSLELESFKDTCMVELSWDQTKNPRTLGEHMKVAFGSSWKDLLCKSQLEAGKIEPGHPSLLVISSSALRSLELLRELRPFTRDCPPAKLFSKHMKIEEQVSFLKNRVNIASGTPSRIKKLIDVEALGLSRLAVLVLDIQTDVKGYSLLTLPQVRDEFWDLYKSYFHQRVLEGALRICLHGQLPQISDAREVFDD
nr:protein CMSS1 [Ipomoea trifida]